MSKLEHSVKDTLRQTFADRNVLFGLALGQVLSLLITGTGVASQYLTTKYDVEIPTTQSSLNYLLLLIIYMPYLLYLRSRKHQNSNQDANNVNNDPLTSEPIPSTNRCPFAGLPTAQ